jgi:hypothetical protein
MLAAAWVTAIATAGLLVGAIVTAWYAIRTFTIQASQLKLLEVQRRDDQALTRQQIAVLELQGRQIRQSLAEREAQAARDRAAQAQHIMVWQSRDRVGSEPGGPYWVVVAHVENRSEEPVTEVQFEWHRSKARFGVGKAREVGLEAGEQDTDTTRAAALEDGYAAVCFRDANGVRWRRSAVSGELEQLPSVDEAPRRLSRR